MSNVNEIIQEQLPYAETALEPVISAKTISFHTTPATWPR